jgi:predicted MFS family arabinose efflux permease
MLVVNAAAAPLILAVPVLHWSGQLTFGLLLAIVFAVGALFGPYFAAQRVALSELLGDDEGPVSDANAFLQAAQRVTMLLGPVLAGVLITLIGAPSVLIVDAATFAFALAAIALFVPSGERPAPTEESQGLLAGIRYLARDRALRGWTISVAASDAAWSALFATLPFYAFEEYDGNAKLAGLLFACFGVSAVVGNVVSFRIRHRVDSSVLIPVGVLLQAAPLWLLVWAGPAWVVALALLLAGFVNGVINPTLHALLTLAIPAAVRQQALTVFLAADQLAAPVGFVGAGLLLAHYGTGPVFVAVPAVVTVAMAWRALATVRGHGLRPLTAPP